MMMGTTIGSKDRKDDSMLESVEINIGTIVIALILIAAVVFAVRSIVMQKKKGRCSCGCDCGSCAMSGSCHQ